MWQNNYFPSPGCGQVGALGGLGVGAKGHAWVGLVIVCSSLQIALASLDLIRRVIANELGLVP